MDGRARLLSAAYKALKREGAERLSLRSVAKAAGVTPMAVYRHFANKDALFDDLVLDGLARWHERVQAIRPGPPLGRIEAVGEAFLDFYLEEPAQFEAAFFLPSGKARRFPDDFAAGRSPPGAIVIKDMQEALKKGDIEAPSALDVWMSMWG